MILIVGKNGGDSRNFMSVHTYKRGKCSFCTNGVPVAAVQPLSRFRNQSALIRDSSPLNPLKCVAESILTAPSVSKLVVKWYVRCTMHGGGCGAPTSAQGSGGRGKI